jgi:hypothetical protein
MEDTKGIFYPVHVSTIEASLRGITRDQCAIETPQQVN